MRSRELGCTCIARQTHSLFITMALRGVKNRTQTPACTSSWPNFPFEKHPHSHYDLLNERPNTALARSLGGLQREFSRGPLLLMQAGWLRLLSADFCTTCILYYVLSWIFRNEKIPSPPHVPSPTTAARNPVLLYSPSEVPYGNEQTRIRTCMYSKYIHNDPRGMSVLSLVGMT
jgi:hypothetical protein